MALTEGVALARAEAVALQVFRNGQPPTPDAIYAALRPLCADPRETDQVWALVQVRLAEMQAAADGYPVTSINERAA